MASSFRLVASSLVLKKFLSVSYFQDLVDGMFRIGTAAVIPPQPPVPSDGYHSGYSSGNERTAVSAYSLASHAAGDPASKSQKTLSVQ